MGKRPKTFKKFSLKRKRTDDYTSGTPKSISLPKRGVKDSIPNLSDPNQARTLRKARKSMGLTMNVSKGSSSRFMNKAILDSELPNGIAKWIESRGKFSQTFGYSKGSESFLFPEEWVFLMDRGILQVERNGIPISIQEGIAIMIKSGVSISKYQTFSYLRRIGYVVFRSSLENVNKWWKDDKKENLVKEKNLSENENENNFKETETDNSKEIESLNEPIIKNSFFSRLRFNPFSTEKLDYTRVHESVRCIKNLEFPYNNNIDGNDKNSNLAKVDYFVYTHSSKNFRKTNPGKPTFCIALALFQDDYLSLPNINILLRNCHGIPLNIALVDSGNVIFFGISSDPIEIVR